MEPRSADARVVLITAPDEAVGRKIAHALVASRAAVCVNVVPGVHSIYRWQGALEEASEVLLIAKTTAAHMGDLERELAKVHPYEVPECVALEPRSVAPRYLAWLARGGEAAP
jgi:periplasmic divalent cation tolerance protein